ncbi:MAG: CPXCG motif-containing cysteine-rich protein [Planctomycetes bacterium]|nr:CPXCG motif-containing cysteine-rich protein [Planctomycetota bacterium]
MHAEEEARYECPKCGEEIVVPIDVPAGSEQEYVEDCPVCCAPIVIQVHVDEDGEVSIRAEAEAE